MAVEGDIDLDNESILQAPIEQLALGVLVNFDASEAWSRHNWLMAAQTKHGRGEHVIALEEALVWLEVRGLLVKNPDQSGSDARVITRTGRAAIDANSMSKVISGERLGVNLHPSLGAKVRAVFMLGDYETAAFKAMKEVEVRVRELSGESSGLIGVKLMRKAFNPENGPLSNPDHEGGERAARSELFAGAIGSFKNPTSHRTVEYNDPTEASEVILLADLLMRILDSVPAPRS